MWITIQVFLIQLQRLAPRVACLAAAPNSSRRFGPANKVKERLHWSALQRLSGLNEALALFVLDWSPAANTRQKQIFLLLHKKAVSHQL
ncbi:hypothetical protein G3A_22210 [Bacillus sp. 17376]|nr:hypothetical protein G3A_22210 [Bacillus sp. 17376]